MPEARFRRVVVFGATSGIAQAVIRRLASEGAAMVLVARDPERLEAVAADARARGADRVVPVASDLGAPGALRALVGQAGEALGAVDLAVVAQGVLADSDEVERAPALLPELLQTNLVGAAVLCQAAALWMAEHGGGCLVGISSVAGDRGRASLYAYGASKAGLSVFVEGLRLRMQPRGVTVVDVKPGWVDTAMTSGHGQNGLFASPDAVARDILRAAARGTPVLYTPRFWRLVMLVVRALPEWVFVRLPI